MVCILAQGVGVQVGWQGQLGSSKGQAGVQVGMGVSVDVGVYVGDPVLVGVSVGVQEMIPLGTGSRRS